MAPSQFEILRQDIAESRENTKYEIQRVRHDTRKEHAILFARIRELREEITEMKISNARRDAAHKARVGLVAGGVSLVISILASAARVMWG
jgi:TPP-dependent indolepyruvate ferredoxin oxidoreductase alpha subunit